jgi:predicted DNA-binding transcriptional regulator YafY
MCKHSLTGMSSATGQPGSVRVTEASTNDSITSRTIVCRSRRTASTSSSEGRAERSHGIPSQPGALETHVFEPGAAEVLVAEVGHEDHARGGTGRSASGLSKLLGVATDISPTARALRAMEILQARPGATAGELADGLGVTERAARRYVEILREAGIPVESTRGPYGGYRLGRGTRLPPVVFTESEALGLVMAVLDDAGDDFLGTALSKVIRALPESVGRQAAALQAYASAAPDRFTARPDPTIAVTLVAAIADQRRILVTYRSEGGNTWEAEVDPWAVVVRFGRWYLLCHSHRADAIRTYRIDRIGAVQATEHHFEPPDGLDPVATVEENLGVGWEYPTRVAFDAPLSEVAPWIRPPMGRLEEAEHGCVLVGSTSNPSMYAQEWLARLPFGFQVEGGPELEAAVKKLAARFAAATRGSPSAPLGPATSAAPGSSRERRSR